MRANDLGVAPGRLSRGTAGFTAALSGRMTVESIICFEKPLVSVFDRLKMGNDGQYHPYL